MKGILIGNNNIAVYYDLVWKDNQKTSRKQSEQISVQSDSNTIVTKDKIMARTLLFNLFVVIALIAAVANGFVSFG